jgi:hypothetical protein
MKTTRLVESMWVSMGKWHGVCKLIPAQEPPLPPGSDEKKATMNVPDLSRLTGAPGLDGPPDVAEISLLLPGWQLAALETAARARGLTSAQLVRRLLREFINRHEDDELEAGEKLNVSCQW